jgi:hypothetical protein
MNNDKKKKTKKKKKKKKDEDEDEEGKVFKGANERATVHRELAATTPPCC